ncbi:MAG TPA: ABC transporter ATP-binding protein [Spirochaetota bacterium]|nr:ABC transporter ATP-binding protein [Spirochaetota bacterium]HOM38083.1 ABC transporter ATP-binding protein [Spirochaetota bacterium]HPQ48885.1 ABC transporter ATP-binding protein [Spirochaetota bacterium]
MFDIKIDEINLKSFFLKPFHIKIENGITGIIGENGSGKTTLLKTIAGIIDYKGKIYYNNTDIKKIKTIEYIPPIIQPLFPIKVIDFFLASLNSLVITPENRIRIYNISKNLGITDLLEKEISKISYGEIVKILFAKSIITKKKIILWDEPTSFIDIKYKIFLAKIIKRFSKKIKFIITSHDFKWLNNIIDNFILLKDKNTYFYSRKINKSDIKKLFNI